MDPATIYAITVTLVGIGKAPEVTVEPLPPQWTMEDCIKDHEKKLAGKPNTMARCVSRDRPYINAEDENEVETVYGFIITFGFRNRTPIIEGIDPDPPISLEECKKILVDRFSNKWGVRGYCVKTRNKLKTCAPYQGKCKKVTT